MGHAFYMNRAFVDREGIVGDADTLLSNLNFGTYVGTGLSGTLVAPLLADMSKGNRNFMIVRKQGAPFTHSSHMVEGDFKRDNNRFVFVDDTIDSSATLLRVLQTIESVHKENLVDEPIMVGAFFYDYDCGDALFFTPEKLINHIEVRTSHYKRSVGEACIRMIEEFM